MTNETASALYVGRVRHLRFRPRRHKLAYRVFWMLLDLDEIDGLARRLRIFSRNRFNLYAFRDADYGDRSGAPLRPQIEALLREAELDPDGGPIRLLTMPRILGYAFNPLSTWFCHRRDGTLMAIVYEVHNTFGERHSYVLPADGDGAIAHGTAKAMHVSPFLGMDMRYAFRVQPPGERLSVAIRGEDGDGPMIVAALSGERRPLTDGMLARMLAAYPLMTLKVTAGIHWHALRMMLRGFRIYRHPARDVAIVPSPNSSDSRAMPR
jgi:DUF1365 family protein